MIIRRLAAVCVIMIIGMLSVPMQTATAAAPKKCDPRKRFDVGIFCADTSKITKFFACKTPPVPQMPGRGFSGFIDSGPAKPDLTVLKSEKSQKLPVYSQVQYPPSWTTYDLGCTAGLPTDPGATLDTTIGNWLKGAATSIVALCNSMNRLVSPPTFMSRLNPLLIQGSAALRDAIFKPYVGPVLMLIGIGIIVAARRKQLPKATEAVVWAIFVMTIAISLWQEPVKAENMASSAATSVIGSVNSHIYGAQSASQDPSAVRADLLTQNVLYTQWLQGELGSSTSTTAKKYGRRLLDDQTLTYAQADQLQRLTATGNPLYAKVVAGYINMKQTDFQNIANKIKTEDPDAYNHLKGSAGGRIGAGAVSLVAAIFTAPFMIVANLMIVIALLIIGFVVIFFAVIALAGMFLQMRSLIITVFERSLGAVINAVVFAAGAAINALAVSLFLQPNIGIPAWASILLCGVVSLMLWSIMKPFRRIGKMVSLKRLGQAGEFSVADRRRHRLSRHRAQRRMIRRLTRQRGGQQPIIPQEHDDEHEDIPELTGVSGRVARRFDALPESWSPGPVEDEPEPEPDIEEPPPPPRRYRVRAEDGRRWRIWNPETGTYDWDEERSA
jgi:hypothetical protein